MDPILLGVILSAAGEAAKFALDSIMLVREAQNSGWTDDEVKEKWGKMLVGREAAKADWKAAGEPPQQPA
jgi:hypothetical protein